MKFKSPFAIVDNTVCELHLPKLLEFENTHGVLKKGYDLTVRVTRDYKQCWYCKYEMEHDFEEKIGHRLRQKEERQARLDE